MKKVEKGSKGFKRFRKKRKHIYMTIKTAYLMKTDLDWEHGLIWEKLPQV